VSSQPKSTKPKGASKKTSAKPTPKKRPWGSWVFFGIALFLSIALTFAYWFFEKQNDGPLRLLILFVTLLPAVIGTMELVHKLPVSRTVGYGVLLGVCGLVFAITAFTAPGPPALLPPHLPKEPPPPPPPPPDTPLVEKTPPNATEWRVIATELLSQTNTDGKHYTRYQEGEFDLSKDRFIRITFEPSQAGIHFLLRLVHKDANPDKSAGTRGELIRIPKNGIVTLPLSAKEFGLTPEKMRQLSQIAVISGSQAWEISLKQHASKQAVFKKIETQ